VSRYTIAGFRNGEVLHTPGCAKKSVQLHPNDGAAELDADQLTYFRGQGFVVTKTADAPPANAVVLQGPESAEIRAAMERAEVQVAEATRTAHAAVSAATAGTPATKSKSP
jgi:hypothetical protein